MIVDSSAVIAILKNEPEAADFVRVLSQSRTKLIGAPIYLECYLVVEPMKLAQGVARLDEIIRRLEIETIDFKAVHAIAARLAFQKFGKGQGHPAQLNFGDCMAYAIAKVEMMPLLYKGEDFGKTDVERAI